jgi:hypothetical protein
MINHSRSGKPYACPKLASPIEIVLKGNGGTFQPLYISFECLPHLKEKVERKGCFESPKIELKKFNNISILQHGTTLSAHVRPLSQIFYCVRQMSLISTSVLGEAWRS